MFFSTNKYFDVVVVSNLVKYDQKHLWFHLSDFKNRFVLLGALTFAAHTEMSCCGRFGLFN